MGESSVHPKKVVQIEDQAISVLLSFLFHVIEKVSGNKDGGNSFIRKSHFIEGKNIFILKAYHTNTRLRNRELVRKKVSFFIKISFNKIF